MSDSAIQKYQGFTPDLAEEVAQATAKQSKFFKLKQGKNQLRVLPANRGNKPVVVTYNHFVELEPGVPESKVNLNCPAKMARKPCPICARAQELNQSPNKRDKDRAKKLFSKLRVYAVVIDRKDEEAGPQVWAFGKTILDDLKIIQEDSGDFCNPGGTGFDVIVRKTGSTEYDTEYKTKAADHKSPMFDEADAMDEAMKLVPSLAQYAHVPTLTEMKEAMDAAMGREPEPSREPGDDDDEEAAPPRSAGRRAPKSEVIDTEGVDEAWD